MSVFRKCLNFHWCDNKLAFLAGTLLVVASSYCDVFTVYSDAFKATFNLTQPEMELLGTTNIVAGVSTFPAGLIHDHRGTVAALLVGMVTWTAGSLALCWSLTMVSVINIPTAVLIIAIALWAHGRTYAFITGLVNVVHSVSPNFRTPASAFAELALNIGSLTYVLVYDRAFLQNHVTDAENQNLLGFYVLQTCVAVLAYSIALFALYKRPADNAATTKEIPEIKPVLENHATTIYKDKSLSNLDKSTETTRLLVDSQVMVSSYINEDKAHFAYSSVLTSYASERYPRDDEDISLLRIVFGVDFLRFLAIFSILISETEFYSIQMNVFTSSLDFSAHNNALVTLFRVVVVVGLSGSFFLMMSKNKKLVRLSLLFAGNLLSLLGYICMVSDTDHVWSLYASSVCQGLSFSFLMAILPSTADEFSSKYLATLFGILATVGVIFLAILQIIFGFLYKSQITEPGSNYCYGKACLSSSLWMFVGLGVAGTLLCATMIKCRGRGT